MSAPLMDIATALLTANEFGLMTWIQSLGAGGRDRDRQRQVERAARVAARRIQRRYDAAAWAAIQQASDTLRRPARPITARR